MISNHYNNKFNLDTDLSLLSESGTQPMKPQKLAKNADFVAF